MARKIALIPEELISSYQYQKPELRIENNIISLLDREKLPDDMKAKLLSQLVMRFQKTVHLPMEPIPVSIANNQRSNDIMETRVIQNNQQPNDRTQIELNEPTQDDKLKDILVSVPSRVKKYVPLLAEKLKTRNYQWNSDGELTYENEPIKGSRIVDLFSYIFRDAKKQIEPPHFSIFFNAIKEINIPRSWIVNKKVLERLQKGVSVSSSKSDKNLLVSDTKDIAATSNVPQIGRAYDKKKLSTLMRAKKQKIISESDINCSNSKKRSWSRSRNQYLITKWINI